MSRKHNTKHQRSRSHYKDRLVARGLSRTPLMTRYDAAILQACQKREGRMTALGWYLANNKNAAA